MFCTDVRKDGKMEGPALELYKNLVSKFPELHIIASGGVSSTGDLEDLMKAGCKGVIVGKAIYEGKLTLRELFSFHKTSLS
jgi:phosphoribosylformimino-5-aminoimidazole carboxamide ribotide isomerase